MREREKINEGQKVMIQNGDIYSSILEGIIQCITMHRSFKFHKSKNFDLFYETLEFSIQIIIDS